MTVAAQHPDATTDATTNEDILLRDERGRVAILTMNRPKARNSLSDALLAALHEAVDAIARDPDIGAVVLTGNGPAFCSGHDLKEMTGRRGDADRGQAAFEASMNQCAAMMQAVMASPKPVVAAVNGTATAAGCQLVMSCDLAVASADAKFATPGVNIGLFCSAPMVAMTRNINRKHAMEMLLLGDLIGAEDARRFGIVNRVVPAEQVFAEAFGMAATIASKPAATVAVGKRTFQRQLEQPIAEAYRSAAATMVASMLHQESAEGIGAFLDKRAPKWRSD